jgi:(R,R)-butanediol dehydrogenase / meso-butanediol dehydrogenase / diacetyl reductase
MKALRWHKRGEVRLEEVEDAKDPQADEIRIAVEWCGICGTDVEEYTSGPIVIPTRPHPLTGFQAPMIIGHEVAGRITDVGKNVHHLRPGQLVGLDGSFFCGSCNACRRHQPNLCERWAFIGMSYPGGLAESMTVPAYMAAPVSEDTPAEWIALAETFSVAVRAVRRGRLCAGESAVVLGAGPVGLAILQVANVAGAASVIVVDPNPLRRKKAHELGASSTIEASGSIVETLDQGKGGPDVAFDCTGSNVTPGIAVAAVRPGGRVVQVGLPPVPGTLDFLQLALREVELIGCIGHVYDEDYCKAVELIVTRRVNPQSLITHRLSLAEAVPRGLALLATPEGLNALKIIITPRQPGAAQQDI